MDRSLIQVVLRQYPASFLYEGSNVRLLKYRVNRATFWSFVAVLMAFIAVAFFAERSVSHLSVVLAVPCILRMHDLGWSGWWSTPVYGLQLAIGLAGLLFANEGHMGEAYLLMSGTLAAWILLLGCLPGDTHPNRFGRRPLPGVDLGWARRAG